ncbi:MAG TPA: hypothetical protein VIM69_03540 [Opitutaceae bacterium]
MDSTQNRFHLQPFSLRLPIRIGIFIAAVYDLALTATHAPWHVYPMQIMWPASIALTSGVVCPSSAPVSWSSHSA